MWMIILTLLLIGLALIVIELVFIPGTTIIGLLGAVFSIAGIIISYKQFGSQAGNYILLGLSITLLAVLFYSFRSGAWSKFALKSSIDGKVNQGMHDVLHVGDEGRTISTLRPVGRAEFNHRQYEVKTLGDYLDTGTRIRIKQLLPNQIIVEPANNNI